MASTDTAVTVVEQSTEDAVVEWNLDAFPTDAYNRLLPTQTLMVPTDLLRPVVQIVKLNPDPNAGDVYHSNDMPDGHAAPTRVGLRKLATAAGISIVNEHRLDDGRDPDVIEMGCEGEMLLPTGQRIRVPGTKRVDLNAQTWKTPQHRAKYRSFFQEQVASRAQNRAMRGLMSLRGSYPAAVYEKPFAVVSFAPNMAHPEVRARILDAMAGTTAHLYGPAADQRQLGPGQTIDVTPAPEEDPAPATPTVLPGEKLTAAEPTEAPSWINAGKAEAAPAAKAPVTLLEVLRASAADPASPKGKATKSILGQLGEVFASIGWDVLHPAFLAVWPDGNPAEPMAAQARALIVAASSDPDFEDHFRALVESGAGS